MNYNNLKEDCYKIDINCIKLGSGCVPTAPVVPLFSIYRPTSINHYPNAIISFFNIISYFFIKIKFDFPKFSSQNKKIRKGHKPFSYHPIRLRNLSMTSSAEPLTLYTLAFTFSAGFSTVLPRSSMARPILSAISKTFIRSSGLTSMSQP